MPSRGTLRITKDVIRVKLRFRASESDPNPPNPKFVEQSKRSQNGPLPSPKQTQDIPKSFTLNTFLSSLSFLLSEECRGESFWGILSQFE